MLNKSELTDGVRLMLVKRQLMGFIYEHTKIAEGGTMATTKVIDKEYAFLISVS